MEVNGVPDGSSMGPIVWSHTYNMYGRTYIARVWINRVRLPVLHVVS